jgi:hypothetical protein
MGTVFLITVIILLVLAILITDWDDDDIGFG